MKVFMQCIPTCYTYEACNNKRNCVPDVKPVVTDGVCYEML